MQVLEVTPEVKKHQKIQLVKGEFTPSEASFVINALLDQKINFHKLQRLQDLEGNHDCETNELDGRIKELMDEKQTAKEFFAMVRNSGLKLQIDGIIDIKVAK